VVSKCRKFGIIFVALALLVTLSWCIRAQTGHDDNSDFPFIDLDNKTIQYEDAPPTDAVARLEEKLEKGQAKLDYDPKFGYLPSLLKNLDIKIDTQLLVFSKTSFQAPRISLSKPRALYFNDAVSIGTVQNGQVFEVMSLDPKQGEIFYTLDVHKDAKPSFHREGIACLQCHYSPATLNISGMEVSSVYPAADGTPFLRAGAYATDHRIPIEDRWGGWYVTGAKGPASHRGNAVARNPQSPTELDLGGGDLTPATLDQRFDVSPYLTNTSDIVSLMTLEHQTRITNLLTRIGWETRIAIEEGITEAFRKRLDFVADQTVTYMLFADEAPLHEPIQGSSTFSETFPQRGPRDKQGRSLRDFDLQTRLFRYPLSYMIYSQEFDNLPAMPSEAIYRKLYDVLTGNNQSEKFKRLSAEEQQAILEILRGTKPNLPAYWKTTAGAR
jgi:hypothetical protein